MRINLKSQKKKKKKKKKKKIFFFFFFPYNILILNHTHLILSNIGLIILIIFIRI